MTFQCISRWTLMAVVATMVLTSCGKKQVAEEPSPNNLFASLLGKSGQEVQARMDSLWTHFFTPGDLSRYEADGESTVYYEVGDSMGIILDTGNNDVRSEGMSSLLSQLRNILTVFSLHAVVAVLAHDLFYGCLLPLELL